jgi:ABC-2 type transport system permease protein
MIKFIRVFWNEYTRHVLRRRFFFAIFSIPFFILVIAAISVLSVILSTNTAPIGYVDHSKLLAHPQQAASSTAWLIKPIEMIPFPDENKARSALLDHQIQAYYVLAPDYQTTSHTELYYLKEPDTSVQGEFENFLRTNILSTQPDLVAQRLSQRITFVIQSVDGKQELDTSEWYNLLLPIISGVLFIIIVFSSGGYLMQAVVEEKENRTMEMVITSVSPGQLMAGKIAGDIGVGLTQLLAWIGLGSTALWIGSYFVPWMNHIQLGINYTWLLLTLFPSFVMIAALMASVGATVTEAREAQQIIGLFSMPIWIPYWLIYPIMTNPNGPLAVGLSFFPLTAPVTLSLRLAFTEIPSWQLTLNILMLFLFAAGSLVLAGRTFRLGMLRYGKRLSWREVFSKVETRV